MELGKLESSEGTRFTVTVDIPVYDDVPVIFRAGDDTHFLTIEEARRIALWLNKAAEKAEANAG